MPQPLCCSRVNCVISFLSCAFLICIFLTSLLWIPSRDILLWARYWLLYNHHPPWNGVIWWPNVTGGSGSGQCTRQGPGAFHFSGPLERPHNRPGIPLCWGMAPLGIWYSSSVWLVADTCASQALHFTHGLHSALSSLRLRLSRPAGWVFGDKVVSQYKVILCQLFRGLLDHPAI